MAHIEAQRIEGILFDYGGTIDTGGDHWSEVIFRAYLDAGMEIPKPVFRDAYVFAERELARTPHILPHHNFHDLLQIKMQIELHWLADNRHIAASEVNTAASRIADLCYRSARESVEAARHTLAALAAKIPLVLVSNFYGNVQAVLDDFKLSGYFGSIVESAVVGVRKPDPEIFRLGCKALRLPPEKVLVVGDSYRKDIVPAESIGCQVLWIKGKGWTAEEDAQMHPNIIGKLDEITRMLGI